MKLLINADEIKSRYGLYEKNIVDLCNFIWSSGGNVYNKKGVIISKHDVEELFYTHTYSIMLECGFIEYDEYGKTQESYDFITKYNPTERVDIKRKIGRKALFEAHCDILYEENDVKLFHQSILKDKNPTINEKIDIKNGIDTIQKYVNDAWLSAIDQYQQTVQRKNDALPRRMKLLLRYLSGECFSSIETDSGNLSRDLQKAKLEDAKKLKEMYQDLPDLPL